MALTFEQARQIARASAPAGGYTDAQINEWANWAVNNPDVQYSSNPAQQMSNSIVISQQGANEQITFNPVAVTPAAPVGIPDENVKAYVDNLVAVGGTNADIKAAMDLYGVSPEQLARVYNADPTVIRETYNAVQASPVSNVRAFEQDYATREAAKATVTPRGGVETITIQPREQITVNTDAIASLDPANAITVNRGATTSPTTLETGAMGPYLTPPSVTPEQITASYTRFLNRTPGQEEIDFWTDYSRNNNPTQTAEAFINEARKEIGDITRSAYESYLGRTPSQEEIDYWTNYTIENDALQTVDAWRAAADEELTRRGTVSDATTTLEGSGIQGSLVSESTAGLPYGGGIYKRTPEEEARYLSELAGIPVRTTIPTPVIPTTTGISRAMAPYVAPGGPGEAAGYARIRELLASGEYTPEQIREGQRNLGVTDQDIGVATGTIAQPIRMPTPTMPGTAADAQPQSISEFIRSKAPTTVAPTAPSMFSPENVSAQLELERLRSGVSPKNTLTDLYGSFLGTQSDINRVIQENKLTADQLKTMYGADDTGISTLQSMGINPYVEPGPVAGFAEGGLVGNDINRLLQNQRNAVMRESQSRQMLNTMGAPPVKKFSDGGPAGSPSSGVRRLEMSRIRKRQDGSPVEGEMADDMFLGTRPTDETTNPGILPPELRSAIDVPLDLANLAIRGTVGAVAGPAYGLYKGLTSDDFGTKKGVTEARSEAERMMVEITGEPKTQAAKDIMQFVGEKLEAAKIPPMPQFLTTPVPGPGAASALMRSYELAETPPVGGVKLAGDKGAKPVTPPTDPMGFYSPAEKAVINLPQDKGTASQMLAQITKSQGVKPVELRATGLEDYLKGKGNEPVTKQEIQDFLRNNSVQVDEVVLGQGQTLSPEAKKLSDEALSRMEEVDNKLASYFEGVEEVAGQDPYSAFIMLRSSIGRRAAEGDQKALDELNAYNLPPEIKDLVLEFGRNKNEYNKYASQARKMVKPKFDKYNLEGGTNAREIYLTLPGEQKRFEVPTAHSVSPEADTNRLAHIFLDERQDAKGNNVLFVQELQSDWAQQGRDKGFKSPEELATKNAKLADLRTRFDKSIERFEEANARYKNRTPSDNDVELLMDMRRANDEADFLRQEIVKINTGGLPSAPFVTNTEDWLNLALKRVIKEAVDNDIDTVAFIKGEQAANKYSLSTVLDNIEVTPLLDSRFVTLKRKGGGLIELEVDDKGQVVRVDDERFVREFAGKPLSNVIGKEMAEKAMAVKPSQGDSVRFNAEDMVVGGEGMKGFYDNILPKTAEKLLKKLGGGKVEPIKVDMGNTPPEEFSRRFNDAYMRGDREQIAIVNKERLELDLSEEHLGFKITPEMKEMIRTEGLPKFAAGGEVTDFIKRAA